MNKRVIRISVLVVVLAALFVAVGTALANINTLCGSDITAGPNGLVVKKDVYCSFDRIWNWTITKSADQSALTLSTGQQFPVNYTVTASAESTGSYFVEGDLTVRNISPATITVVSVTDSQGPVVCPVTFPYDLPGGGVFHCIYTSPSLNDPPSENIATAVDSNGVSVSATAPIDWSKGTGTETDECANISDTYPGFPPTTVCADGQKTFTYNYTRQIGPYDVCGEYTVPNTASFTTNDTGATGDSSWNVDVTVPCAGGCSLTPGYWKTHSQYGPAPYDDTWAQVGENTIFFYSGKSYYQALWTPPRGNAYWILAHAYIAAKLNQLNGADFSTAQAAFDQATTLFNNPANTPAYIGGLKGSARQTWINLATTLDNYNNGLIGPGHCSE